MPQGSLRRAVVWSVGFGLGLSLLGNMLALGIPGALVLSAAAPLIAAIWPAPNAFPHDAAWPFVIMVTLLWGIFVPVLWLGTRAAGLHGLLRAAAVAIGMLLSGVAICLVLYAISVAPSL